MKVNKRVFVIALSLLIVLFLCFIFFNSIRKDTFKSEFWDDVDVEAISQIELIRGSDSKQILFSKANEIKAFVDTISEARIEQVKASETKIEESYWITVWIDGERKFGLRIDNHILSVFNYEGGKNNYNLYEFKDKSIFKYIENLF
ncbi:hypothetical protein ACQKMD_07725 [Viridibacillus sp. NPDC096237]|uniref:hypothetical protein n=1 Tax=Viridibacillus sp. NPDC096237 TaxID=3390721 RepID=UPI003D093AD6